MSKRQRNSLTVSAAHPPTLPGDAPPALKQKKAARKAEGSGDPVGITFSLLDKAAIVSLSRDRRTASCSKGYRMVRTTTGAISGSWYFEFAVSADTKQGAHYRLGVSTDQGEPHGPVGYTHHSYGYRDVGGTRVHQSIRSDYGRPYGAGDVVGCLLDFHTPASVLQAAEAADRGFSAGPADGERQERAASATAANVDKEGIEAILHCADPPRAPPSGDPSSAANASSSSSSSSAASKHTVKSRWWGSSLRFFVNGQDQGIAFTHLTREKRLLPAASMYGGGSVRLNPGPVFAFPPDPQKFPPADAPAAADAPAPAAPPSAELAAFACCSPWRPFSDTEEPAEGVSGLPISSLSASQEVASSTLLGTGLLRVGTTGGTAYNFANTPFAYAAPGSKKSEKEVSGRSRKRR